MREICKLMFMLAVAVSLIGPGELFKSKDEYETSASPPSGGGGQLPARDRFRQATVCMSDTCSNYGNKSESLSPNLFGLLKRI